MQPARSGLGPAMWRQAESDPAHAEAVPGFARSRGVAERRASSPVAAPRCAPRRSTGCAHLAAEPPEGAERVILFGFRARADFDGGSGVDVLILGNARLDRRGHEVAGREVDMLIWTPAPSARAMAQQNPFALDIRRDGIELSRAPGRPPL